jgi:gliding motility-associated-like protein
MHSEFLNHTKGVSLERISCDLPSSSLSNWHSASSSAGYSTPGFPNSQDLPATEREEIITISETFSPDNDGTDDLMHLYINLREAGWKASIMVFDRHGRKIRDIATNSLLGTEEQFTWDGTCNSRQKAGIGIYLVYAELITTNGEVKNFKKVVTLIR